MSILQGDTGRASIGPLKTMTASHKLVNQTTIATPADLPIGAYPATPQASFTLGPNDFPTVQGAIGFETNAVMAASGKNTTASTITLYWRTRRNGTTQFNGSVSVSPSQYWTFTSYHYINLVQGDVLEMTFYASVAGVNFSFYGAYTLPSKIDMGNGKIMVDAILSIYDPSIDPKPFTVGSTYSSSNSSDFLIYPISSNSNQKGTMNGGDFSTRVFQNHPVKKTGEASGFASSSFAYDAIGSATISPYSLTLRYLQKLTYRELTL